MTSREKATQEFWELVEQRKAADELEAFHQMLEKKRILWQGK